MPLPTLLHSPPIKSRTLHLLPLLRTLTTHPASSAPTPETTTTTTPETETETEAETETETTPRPLIRRVVFPPVLDPTRPRIRKVAAPNPPILDPTKPRIRKVTPNPPEDSAPPVRRYGTAPTFSDFGAGRPPAAGDGPLIRKTGTHWNSASPTIRKEYNYFAPEEKKEKPASIVIKRPEMTAPGHTEWSRAGPGGGELKKYLTVEQHRLDRPEIETTWVDTHCHLFTTLKMLKGTIGDTTLPDDGIDTLVKALFPPQVTAVVDIHCDLPLSNLHEHALTLEWPPHFKYYFSKGVHPHCAMDYNDEVHESLIQTMSHPSCVAWGECGLDYFKNDVSTHPTQRTVFARQLQAAVAAGKPIVIHTRSADEDTLRILREHVPRDHRMHVHCFTAGPVLAQALMAEWPNSYIGITGVVGYKGMDHVTHMLKSGEIPVGRLLLETDSPYMAPRSAYIWLRDTKPEISKKKLAVSHAGMIPFTAEHVMVHVNAGRGERGEPEMGLVEMLDVTRGNAAKMYGIDV